jgi:Gluconate 2-dehydrogenase subunit 3
MAATSLASALPRRAWAAPNRRSPVGRTTKGYGTDPNLQEPAVPWSLVMEAYQLQQTAALADLILPASATAKVPSALGVPDFVNEWVSAPYPDQLQDKVTIFEGLRWIDAESVRRGQGTFLEVDQRMRQGIVEDIAQKRPKIPFAAAGPFFQRLRFLVVIAYYTTPEGFQDIGYTGNVPLAAYPAMTDEEHAILDGALAKLGLL